MLMYFNSLPKWDQESEFWVNHGLLEVVMLGIVGDPIDPGRLAYSSLTQDEDIDVFLVIPDWRLSIQQRTINNKKL